MEYKISQKGILVSLPITTPTSKVRVKRPQNGFAAEPLACRTLPMRKGDYLEWQISYDTDNLHEPSILKEIVLQKPKGVVRYGCELVRLIAEGLKLEFISAAQIKELKSILVSDIAGIEENEKILKESVPANLNTIGTKHGFTRFYLHIPNYIKEGSKYAVEIKIANKQRAVGNQAMIFLNLPVEYCVSQNDKPLIGRTAEKNEYVNYLIDKSNCELIYDTTLAFAIASLRHRRDMNLIFEALKI